MARACADTVRAHAVRVRTSFSTRGMAHYAVPACGLCAPPSPGFQAPNSVDAIWTDGKMDLSRWDRVVASLRHKGAPRARSRVRDVEIKRSLQRSGTAFVFGALQSPRAPAALFISFASVLDGVRGRLSAAKRHWWHSDCRILSTVYAVIPGHLGPQRSLCFAGRVCGRSASLELKRSSALRRLGSALTLCGGQSRGRRRRALPGFCPTARHPVVWRPIKSRGPPASRRELQ